MFPTPMIAGDHARQKGPLMQKPRILIADDDPALVASLTIRFRQEGYDVLTGFDGQQALQVAREQQPDLLLLDVKMPAGDGLSVHDRLQESQGPWPPVIYLTGDRSLRTELNVKKHGAFAVIYKPFDTSHLLETVRRALACVAHAK